SLYPIGNEHVGFVGLLAVAMGDPNQLLAIGAEHGEAVEAVAVGDALEARAVDFDGVEFEIAHAAGRSHVGGENDALAVRKERRGEAGGIQAGELALATAIGFHEPDFKRGGTNQILLKKLFIFADLGVGLGMIGAVDDPLAVFGIERAAVVAELVRELLDVLAVGVHRINVEVAVARGSENDLFAVFGDGGFGIVAGRGGELLHIGAVEVGGEDVVSRINGPHVALGEVGPRRAGRVGQVRRGIKNLVSVREDVAACGAALAGRDHLLAGAVYVHGENLVALQAVAGGLEDQLLAVGREIGLGIRAAEGELAHVAEMLFFGRAEVGGGCTWG